MGLGATHSDDWRGGRLYVGPDLYDALSARPDWQGLIDGCEYRAAGWLVRAFLRLAGLSPGQDAASAVTLNGVAYVKEEDWFVQDHAVAALAVHEALHAAQERSQGWWRFAFSYLWWRVTHWRTPIRESPYEREAYRVEDEVGALLNR